MTYSIGIRVYGFATKVDDNQVPKVNTYYETQQKLNGKPPAGQEKDFLLYIKQKVETEEHVHVNYASISNENLVVQWKSLGSPIAISTIVAIIVIAIALFGLAAVLSQTYMIATTLGSETIGQVFSVVGLIFVLMFISSILSIATGFMPKMRRRED